MEYVDIERMSNEEVDSRIREIKARLGSRVFMPVHHYQRDEIVQFADVTGDSLQLSRVSAKTDAEFIVFCGVYFMAEIARVLAPPDKHVFIPDKNAGCPLADYASIGDVLKVWEHLNHDDFIPITYANSHAEIKAFCGENNGLVCTSSNATKLFSWVLGNLKKVFFLPDVNLGINTSEALGLKDYAIVDGNTSDFSGINDKNIVIWNGNCPIHRVFTIEHVRYWREKEPEAKIIVHPECTPDVVKASDMTGSTAGIKRAVEDSPAGSRWVIGTELNFVERLKRQNPDKFIAPLEESICMNMSKIRRRKLLKTLIQIEKEDYSEEVVVSSEVSEKARIAINRMLELS